MPWRGAKISLTGRWSGRLVVSVPGRRPVFAKREQEFVKWKVSLMSGEQTVVAGLRAADPAEVVEVVEMQEVAADFAGLDQGGQWKDGWWWCMSGRVVPSDSEVVIEHCGSEGEHGGC